MNLTQPPFDDIHVRRAMNWIIDKAALRQVWGGPADRQDRGPHRPRLDLRQPARRVRPVRDARATTASLAKAKAAMKGSKYDTKHDGMCSAAACHDVLLLIDAQPTFDQRMLPIDPGRTRRRSASPSTSRSINGAYPTLADHREEHRDRDLPGWGKDYADPLTFFQPLFDGRTIIPQGNTTTRWSGSSPSQAKSLGVTGNVTRRPERRRTARPLRRARRPGAPLVLRERSTRR